MNVATDDHRYVVTAPWGDRAYADTRDEALTARRTLARDRADQGLTTYYFRVESITIIDRGPAPKETATS